MLTRRCLASHALAFRGLERPRVAGDPDTAGAQGDAAPVRRPEAAVAPVMTEPAHGDGGTAGAPGTPPPARSPEAVGAPSGDV